MSPSRFFLPEKSEGYGSQKLYFIRKHSDYYCRNLLTSVKYKRRSHCSRRLYNTGQFRNHSIIGNLRSVRSESSYRRRRWSQKTWKQRLSKSLNLYYLDLSTPLCPQCRSYRRKKERLLSNYYLKTNSYVSRSSVKLTRSLSVLHLRLTTLFGFLMYQSTDSFV